MKAIHTIAASLIASSFVLTAPVFAQATPAPTGALTTASVTAEGAWARTSVPGQKATGAFMKLTAKDNLQLVSASSPVAGITEIHEMKIENDVMKMRAVTSLELPAGKAVELKPGGYHVMLLDLKAPLAKDTTVPLTLVFKDAKGAETRLELKVPVAVRAPATVSQ